MCAIILKKARAMLDTRAVTNAAELVDTLLILDGERTEGQAAIFRKVSSETSKERPSRFSCFNCGKSGHKAADCWSEKGGTSSARSPASVGSTFPKVTCYTCGEIGHKSPQCTKE